MKRTRQRHFLHFTDDKSLILAIFIKSQETISIVLLQMDAMEIP